MNDRPAPGDAVDELAAFEYELDPALVAQHPVEPRSSARLLDATGAELLDRNVFDLPSLVKPGEVVVVNDTRVIPARVALHRDTGGRVEFLFLEERSAGVWLALCNPSRKVVPGSRFFDPAGAEVLRVIERQERSGDSPVKLTVELADAGAIERLGETPLPPYIKAPLADPERYQTVFASRPSSAAAPTAGLHLDDAVLEGIRSAGAEVVRVELSVGLDTFLPVKSTTIEGHRIHTESYRVEESAWRRIGAARRVLAVGTTVVRTLETAAATGQLAGRSSLYIHGDFPFKVVDRLMTNFHIPRSSLLLLVDAFVGERWREIYEHGIAERYRFFSFGDAMLLERRGLRP